MAILTREAPLQGANDVTLCSIASAGVVATTTLYVFDRLESGTISGWHTKGNFMLDLVSKSDHESLDTVFDTYLVLKAENEVTQSWIDGNEDVYNTSTSNTHLFAFISYSGEVEAKRRVDFGCGVFTGDTGNRAYQGNTMGGTTIQIKAVETAATLTFASSLLNTALVTGYTAALSLPAGKKSTYDWVTAA